MFVCAECGQRYDRPGYCAAEGKPLVASDDPLLGTDIGRYRVASVIGEGGMGRVYRAVQPMIGSRVAIKVLSDQCARNPELLERFFSEARAVNMIRHENIVSVIDLSRLEDGRPFIVMEFVEGKTLAELIRARRGSGGAGGGGPEPSDDHAPLGGVVQVMGEVLSALAAAHAIGIVHRDLKPDNVLVTAEGHAKVLDFGIAKLAPGLSHLSPRTRTGALLGTPSYMAPEQISGGGRIDPRTDVYAAGVVLFEAVTGRVPFQSETLFDLMREHLETAPPPPSKLRRELPASIEQVILTALAKQPEHRFQTAQAMASALNHASVDLPEEQWRALSVRGAPIPGGARSSLASGKLRRPPPSRPPEDRQPDRQNARTVPDDPLGFDATAIARPLAKAPTTAGAIPQLRTEPKPKKRTALVAGLAAVAIGGAVTAIVLAARRGSGESIAVADPAPPSEPAPDPEPAPVEPTVVVEVPAKNVEEAAPPPAPPEKRASGGNPSVVNGPGVTQGPNVGSAAGLAGQPVVATPTHFTRPVDFAPKSFHGLAYLPKAYALAKSVWPDVGLVSFDLNNVFPDGHSDLTLPDGEAIYRFRSPSHSARPAGLPRNKSVDVACYVWVTLTATQIEVRTLATSADEHCKAQLRPYPKCTPAAVWGLAKLHKASPDTVAKVELLPDGTWWFDNQDSERAGVATSYPDQCP
ncbi:MAG: serine/threonine protein kinase [Deltaproteobacteria bacterium]|nr:serine/threonine protein kinase [Deltaproteobacteria bacterium]